MGSFQRLLILCIRKEDQSISDFIADWDNCYHRLRKVNCEYTDTVLGFKLLEDAKLKEVETKLVLTGVNYEEVKNKQNLKEQVANSLKKFTGRAVLATDNHSQLAVNVKEEPTWVAEVETVLLSQGWKPPAREGRRRSRSAYHLHGGKNRGTEEERTFSGRMGNH
jgi:hypothetical protein